MKNHFEYYLGDYRGNNSFHVMYSPDGIAEQVLGTVTFNWLPSLKHFADVSWRFDGLVSIAVQQWCKEWVREHNIIKPDWLESPMDIWALEQANLRSLWCMYPDTKDNAQGFMPVVSVPMAPISEHKRINPNILLHDRVIADAVGAVNFEIGKPVYEIIFCHGKHGFTTAGVVQIDPYERYVRLLLDSSMAWPLEAYLAHQYPKSRVITDAHIIDWLLPVTISTKGQPVNDKLSPMGEGWSLVSYYPPVSKQAGAVLLTRGN